MIRSFEGRHPQIADTAYVDETALVIGDVTIGEYSSIWPNTVVRGDIQSVRIGERSNIQDGSILHVTHDSDYKPGGSALVIGDNVTVGHGVILHACSIGNRCLVGMGSIVLDDAVLEDGAMLGAGALVNPRKKLQGGFLWVGSPVRRMRELSDKEMSYLGYSAEHYVRLMQRHKAQN